MSGTKESSAVPGALARMDRQAQRVRLAVYGAAGVEGVLLVVALLAMDWRNETQVLLFVFSILGYTIMALGMVALGAHVSRVGMRVVAALERQRPV
jgi:hypothetical protein